MIQGIVKVKSCETLPTKDGKKTYLSAVLTGEKGDRKYSIFDAGLQKTIQEAHKQGASVKIGLEKEGNFWNLKTAEVTTEQVVSPSVEKTTISERSYRKDDNAIMLQVAFKGAVECEGYWYVPDGKAHTDRVTQNTEGLLIGLQEIMKKRFNPLVEEAKKLGAVEK